MELRFLKWALLLLLLTIVITEGFQGSTAKKNDESPILPRARGSSRYSSRTSLTSTKPPSLTTASSSSPDSSITKASRKVPAVRRAFSSRFGAQSTTVASTTISAGAEGSARKTSPTEAAIEKNSNEESKIHELKSTKFGSRRLISKTSGHEMGKNQEENKDRRYLPENRNDTRTGRGNKGEGAGIREHVEGFVAPEVSDSQQPGSRRSARMHTGYVRSKLDSTGPSIFETTSQSSRSRTGRKAQNVGQPIRQVKSIPLSGTKYSKLRQDAKGGSDSNSSRRNLKRDPSVFRKKLAESQQKHDNTASGSESVRINIPLNFEETRRLGSEGSSTETPKRTANSRYKPRGRLPSHEKKSDPEVTSTTTSPISRGTPRRIGISKNSENPTESTPRSRGRNYEVKKIIENSSTTTAQSELRRRNYSTKTPARNIDSSRGSDSNKIVEPRSQTADTRKSNRPRGRYRVEAITAGPLTSTSNGPSVVTITNTGAILSSYEPEVTLTTPLPIISTTTTRAPSRTTAPASSVTTSTESNRRVTDNENSSQQNSGQRRRASKEDFFNHGLGFRGRRPPLSGTGTDEVPATVTTTIEPSSIIVSQRPENLPRGNPGWTLRRRPGHWNGGLPSGPSANPAEPSTNDQPERGTTITTTTVSSTTKSGRRGNKTFAKPAVGGTKDEPSEGDNYPPDFKARLAQLQKSGQSRTPSEANKATSAEQFAARSKMKLENARKLIKPELLIDETNTRNIIVDPASKVEEDINDSQVDEDKKVIQVTRKSNPPTEKPKSLEQNSSTKSDWKPSKLRKNLKNNQTRISRYKQAHLYTPRAKALPILTVTTEKNNAEENDVEQLTRPARNGRYQDHKHKFVPKLRGTKLRGPKPSHIEGGLPEDYQNLTTKLPLTEKPRKTFIPRKNDKNHVEDIKAVALKLRKSLESMEKQPPKPPRRADSSEGSTTLLTTMRTVKSFSFSTRLVKMDENETPTSSTMKMIDGDPTTPAPEMISTSTSTSSSVVTEFVTQNPAENEITTATLENVLDSNNRPSSDDILINEIENSSASTTSESPIKSTRSPETVELNWSTTPSAEDELATISSVDYQPRASALTNDSGLPVFVVYPSATEKPLIAITPKVHRYHVNGKSLESAALTQQSVMQDPVISVKVSNDSAKGAERSLQDSVQDSNNGNSGNLVKTNIFNPIQSAAILETENATLLEQLRSTVAPLLSTLGAKSPVFAGAYRNTNSANSLPRVTASGSPPKFSARYRGAELFVRRPTPATSLNSISDNESAPRIDVSNPGEPKVLTFYQAVETASINNEQSDVRRLWQFGKPVQLENTTDNDPRGNESSNSDFPQIIPVTVLNINDTVPIATDGSTTIRPDEQKLAETTIHYETTQESNSTLKNKIPLNDVTVATDIPTAIYNRIAEMEIVTASSMSTSTKLVTEVSMSISDQRIPSSTVPAISSESTTLLFVENPITLENTDTTTQGSITTTSYITVPSTDNSENLTVKTTDASDGNDISLIVNTRTPKKLDSSDSDRIEVSTSQPDTNLTTSNNETTKPIIVKIAIEKEPAKATMLEILAQVKENVDSNFNGDPNAENTTEKLELLAMLDISSTGQPKYPSEGEIHEMTPEMKFNKSFESMNPTDTVPSTDSPPTTINNVNEDKVTTTQFPEIVEFSKTIINNNKTSDTVDVEIQLYSTSNATVSAGTEKLVPMEDLLSKNELRLGFEKFINVAVEPNVNFTANLDNNIMEELMRITDRISSNSTKIPEQSFNVDKNNVDSSPEGLPQLLGGFVDNSNKTQSVINNSTVETDKETVVIPQTTNEPITTEPTTEVTYFDNIDSNTEPNAFTLQLNSENVETTTTIPTTIPNLDYFNVTNPLNLTNISAPNITRMLQIFEKLLDGKLLSRLPSDFEIQDVNTLTIPDSTEMLSVVEDLTKAPLDEGSTNQVPTTVSTETRTTFDLTTISPTFLPPLQGSTPATAQRTASANKQYNQAPTTSSSPTTNYPSSSVFSSNVIKTINSLTNNPESSEKPTIPPVRESATLPSLPFIPPTTSMPATKSTTSASLPGRVDNEQAKTSTSAPVRDYHIYGILPNKTIVRKRPEDNLIDPRNVDSPYVIFGIFPDGKLVRKFPNGTVIPDPPINPVEVVFSLDTTSTTNKPRLLDNQVINQGARNKNFDYFNRSPDANVQKAFYEPNEVDNALGSNGPTGFKLPIISPGSTAKKTTATATDLPALNGRLQAGQITQNRSRDEASRVSESDDQTNSVFIGQDKIINYWTDGQPNSNPTVLSVNLTSTATATKEGSLSSIPSTINLNILPNRESTSQVTAPPGFPWNDPLDQIFGISIDSPVFRSSIASNAIEGTKTRDGSAQGRPINNLVEIFSPVSSTINSPLNTPTKPTTTTTTESATTATTTTPAPTTSRPAATSITATPDTASPNAFGTTFDDLAFLNALLEKPNPGEATPKTLTEVEQQLANKILSLALGRPLTSLGPMRSPKAIHASNASPNSLNNDKDWRGATSSPNIAGSSSQPIVIDLSSKQPIITSTTPPLTWKTVKSFIEESTTTASPSTTTTARTTTTTTTTTSTTPRPTTTIRRTTTKTPVIVTAKSVTTRRPRPISRPPSLDPFGFIGNLMQSIFGGNPFAPPPTSRPATRRPAPTTSRATTATTRAPQIVLAQSHTPRSIEISKDSVDISNGHSTVVSNVTPASQKPIEVTSKTIYTPATSTFSPEEDAKFLAALLELTNNRQNDGKSSLNNAKKPNLDSDDEAFLRAILTGQGTLKPLSAAGGNDQNDEALLAAFLKEQGIEPSTPPNSLSEQLHKSSLGKTTTRRQTTSTTTTTTTTTTTKRPTSRRRPASASTYPPPLFRNFGLFASSSGFGAPYNDDAPAGTGARNQVVDAAIGMTRAFGQFLGAAITGAAQQVSTFFKNRTKGA